MAYLTSLWRAGGFEDTKSPGYRFQFQYDKEVIEALKAAVPDILAPAGSYGPSGMHLAYSLGGYQRTDEKD